ncbi:Netrin receptor DCC, partial [Geodia barretti]
DISIPGELAVDSDLNGASPQFTLTCISTGGPATTVTWTRDSTTVTQGAQTVLNDPVTAQYTYTLTVTTAGVYTCTVANNKPSSASASFTLEGPPSPTDVTAVQTGPTSITVTWTPPDPLDGITGYRISFAGGSGVDIDGGSTNSYTLTGLTNGQTYTISIVAIVPNRPTSAPEVREITLVSVPEKPTIDMDIIDTTSTTITISWSLPPDVTGFEVSWELTEQTRRRRRVRNAEGGTSGRLSADQNSYTIDKLRSGTSYDITVTVFNPAGSSSTTFTRSTDGGVIDANQAESTSCECDNTSAIIGGVVAVVLIIATSLTVIVVVILVLRSRSGNYSAKTRHDHTLLH